MALGKIIDLNADLGEDENAEGIARDLAMMEIISSCNIACGGHAGSAENMRRMLEAAKAHGVAAGAHISYPDRANFGRVSMEIGPVDLLESLTRQMEDFQKAADETGVTPTHIKPHGALYNDAQDDTNLAAMLVELAERYGTALVGMAQSETEKKAFAGGIGFIAEAFIDRRYSENLRLVPRAEANAVIAGESERLEQALALAGGQPIKLTNGEYRAVMAQTLCLHSDSDGALQTTRAVAAHLKAAGFEVKPARP